MITYVPSYYRTFKCIAGACRHSCCIGWEIDIDPDTLSRYMSIAGQFGDRLRRGIKDGSFALDADERCPFLNSRGLYNIILTMV